MAEQIGVVNAFSLLFIVKVENSRAKKFIVTREGKQEEEKMILMDDASLKAKHYDQ